MHDDKPLLKDLIGGNGFKSLKRIAKGTEYAIYRSNDNKYLIKKPRIYVSLLGLVDFVHEKENIERCKEYLAEHKLPVLIPETYIMKFKNYAIIIQENIVGETKKDLAKKLTEKIKPFPFEETFIDLSADNFLFSKGKIYLIDVSGGFYYKFARKYGKRKSKQLWHLVQLFKTIFMKSNYLIYQEDKIYTNLELPDFLKSLHYDKRNIVKRIKKLSWHIKNIYKYLFVLS